MATGWGVPHTRGADGTLVGTSDEDIRKITGGLFTEGIIKGASVKTSTSGLTYSIDPGVVNLWFEGSANAKECVLLPIDPITVTTSAGPSTGTRTDYVWVRQAPSSTNISTGSQISYGVSSTNPRNLSGPGEYFVLQQFTVPAGMTKTSSATPINNQIYAVPYGSASLLLELVDTYDGLIKNKSGGLANLTGKFTLPTPQLVEFNLGVTCELSGLQVDLGDRISAALIINGTREAWWNTSTVELFPYTYTWTKTLQLPAGTHTVEFRRTEVNQSGKIWMRYQAKGLQGSFLTAKSLGVVS